MLQKKYCGTSLFEVVVALCLFSVSVLVISAQIESSLNSMNIAEQHVLEVYHQGF